MKMRSAAVIEREDDEKAETAKEKRYRTKWFDAMRTMTGGAGPSVRPTDGRTETPCKTFFPMERTGFY